MLRRNVELLAGAGAPAAEIHSHGGGARSPLWNQVKADVCGLPVVTLRGEDAAIRGDAMLAGVAAGTFRGPRRGRSGDGRASTSATSRTRRPGRPTRRPTDATVELFEALRPVFAASAERRPGSIGPWHENATS